MPQKKLEQCNSLVHRKVEFRLKNDNGVKKCAILLFVKMLHVCPLRKERLTMPDSFVINYRQDINSEGLNGLIGLIENNLNYETIRINIHSYGGNIVDGIAMYNYIKYIKTKNINVWTHNLGAVESAAVLLYLAGDKRTMDATSTFLVHPITKTLENSNYNQITKQLDALNKDIERYAGIVNEVCPKFENIKEYLQSSDLTITLSMAMKLGFITE